MRQRNMDRDRGTRDLRTGAGTEIQGQMDRETGTEVGAETGTRVEFRFSLSLYYTSH